MTLQEFARTTIEGYRVVMRTSYNKFVIVKNPESSTRSKLMVAVNWFEELKRLAPPDKK